MKAKTTNSVMSKYPIKKIQHNIWKRWKKYQVKKMVNGDLIIKSFNKLNDARMFLKTL